MAGTTLGTAYVQIVPSAEGISDSISEVLGGEAESAGKNTGSKIAAFAKKAIAGAAIGKVLKDSLAEGGNLQQSYLGGLDTLYEDAADAARNYAKEAAAAGISMNDYAEQAVSFGAALKSAFGGDVTKAADAANTAIMDMADNSAKMGTDIASIQTAYQGFAKQNYTMLDNLKLGYGGTKQEMERLLEDASKLEAANGKTFDIDNLGDVYEAIHLIQGELGLSGVAAKEAGETLTGSLAAIKANYQNFIGSLAIGEDIRGPLNGLVTSVNNFAFNNLIPMIGNIIKGLPGAIVTFIQQSIPMLLTNIVSFVGSIASSIQNFASSISSQKITEWANTMLPKIIVTAAKLLGNFAKGLLSNLGKIVPAIGQIGLAVIKGLGSAIWPKITAAANGIKERFLAPINNLRDRVRAIIDRIKGFFSFSVSKPHIPLPHFSISPSGWKVGDLLKGTKPSLSIRWYAEGGIMNEPMLFGGGEAGPEAIVPLNTFWKKMDNIANALGSPGASGGTVHVVVQLDGKTIGQSTVDYINGQTVMFGVNPVMI